MSKGADRITVGCIIMASGQGKRYGGNKLMALLKGLPLIDCIIRATDGLFDRRLVVTRHRDVEEYALSLGVEVLLHTRPERSDTIRLGIERMADCSHCLFCMGDQPLIKRESLEKILRAAQQEPERIWRVEAAGIPGTPVLFPQKFFSELTALPTGEGGGYVIRNHPEEVSAVEAESYEMLDVDTPEDLKTVEKYL